MGQRSGINTARHHIDPGYQWESNNVIIRHHKRKPRVETSLLDNSHAILIKRNYEDMDACWDQRSLRAKSVKIAAIFYL